MRPEAMTSPAAARSLSRIVLGLTGGIAAYKAAELTRLLVKEGIAVDVVMTSAAAQFIAPMTLQALSGNPVLSGLWESGAANAMGHIELARWADEVVIAPASALVPMPVTCTRRIRAGLSSAAGCVVLPDERAPLDPVDGDPDVVERPSSASMMGPASSAVRRPSVRSTHASKRRSVWSGVTARKCVVNVAVADVSVGNARV